MGQEREGMSARDIEALQAEREGSVEVYEVRILVAGDEPSFEDYARADDVLTVSVEPYGTYDPESQEIIAYGPKEKYERQEAERIENDGWPEIGADPGREVGGTTHGRPGN